MEIQITNVTIQTGDDRNSSWRNVMRRSGDLTVGELLQTNSKARITCHSIYITFVELQINQFFYYRSVIWGFYFMCFVHFLSHF